MKALKDVQGGLLPCEAAGEREQTDRVGHL